MASAILQELTDEITETRGVLASATTYVNGVPALLDAAIAQALANGASAAELVPLQDLSEAMKTDAASLTAAIAANAARPA